MVLVLCRDSVVLCLDSAGVKMVLVLGRHAARSQGTVLPATILLCEDIPQMQMETLRCGVQLLLALTRNST